MEKHEISLANCIALGVDNTSVNVGKYKSLIVKDQKKIPSVKLLGCPCHIAQNTAHHATNKFEEEINGFKKKSSKDSESANATTLEKTTKEYLVDLYFHFEHSSKKKVRFESSSNFVIKNILKSLDFVRWLGLITCLRGVALKLPSLKAYFCSLNPDKKPGRLNRLIAVLSSPMSEFYFMFLQGSLPTLTHLNLLLQRSDPIIHIMCNALRRTVSVL